VKPLQRRKPRPLSARKMASITPDDVYHWLFAVGWSHRALRWLSQEVPLPEALVHIAIGHHCAPHDILDRLIAMKREQKERRAAEAEEVRRAIEKEAAATLPSSRRKSERGRR
jgi:hypothetical protein